LGPVEQVEPVAVMVDPGRAQFLILLLQLVAVAVAMIQPMVVELDSQADRVAVVVEVAAAAQEQPDKVMQAVDQSTDLLIQVAVGAEQELLVRLGQAHRPVLVV
jgi:hypothetical protein